MRKKPTLLPAILIVLLLILTACSDSAATPAPANGSPQATQANGTATRGQTNNPNVPTPGITLAPLPTSQPSPTVLAKPTKGGNLVGAQLKDATTLHYYKSNTQTGYDYLRLLFAASLTRRNPSNLTSEKNAADSWKVDTGNATVTFTLKNNLKWSDGTPITSDDYLWTYQQARKPENGWSYAAAAFYSPDNPDSTGIESMSAPDSRTLVVKLKVYTFDIVSRADVIQPLPRNIWQKYDWNDPAKNPEINKPSVVSGPWLLKDWKQGDLITFTRNSASSIYPVPYLETLIFKVLADGQVAREKMRAEEIDFFAPEAALQKDFEDLDIVQPFKWSAAQTSWQYVGFNFRKPALQDKALRQALAYATDAKTILDKYGYGLGKLMYSDVTPFSPYYYDKVTRYDYSLDKAKDVLQKAGYTVANNKLLDKNGQEVPPLKLVYNSPNAVRDGTAQTLKQSYATLGLQIETQSLDADNYVKFLINETDKYDLWLGGWQTDYDPENFGEVWRNVPELNNGAYRNDKVISLYNSVLTEQDATKRRLALAQIQQQQADELPYIYLYAEQRWLDVSRRIGGITPSLLGVDYNLFTDWFVIS